MKTYKKTGEKIGILNVIIPDMKFYRPAVFDDQKKPGDLFNQGKWLHKKDKFVKSTMANDLFIGNWHEYYLILTTHERG